MATWGVVTMVKEPPELVAIFASYYASLGAQEINIYLDGDDPEARRLLSQLPNCRVEVMDEAFFQKNWNRAYPKNSFKRQRLIATKAYRESQVDWMLFLDADEYLQSDNFGQDLADLPSDVDTISIPNGERVFSIEDANPGLFGGLMLKPKRTRGYVARDLFGEARLRYSDRGFCAHRFGKSATRTGKNIKLDVHAPQQWKGNIKRHVSQKSVICHFDGLTEVHWMLKLLRYQDMGTYDRPKGGASFRHEQIQFLRNSPSMNAIRELHDIIRKYDSNTESRLRDHGLLDDVQVHPFQGLDKYYPNHEFDLSVEWFNDVLKSNMPALYARLPE